MFRHKSRLGFDYFVINLDKLLCGETEHGGKNVNVDFSVNEKNFFQGFDQNETKNLKLKLA